MSRARSALGIYSGFYLLFLYVPVLMLPLFSFNGSTYAAFPIHHLTWRWYGQLWGDAGLRQALLNSLAVAVPAALVATASGTLAAYALVRGRRPAAQLVASLSVAPLLIPGVILGVALLIGARVIGLAPSLPVMMAGHAVLCMPLSADHHAKSFPCQQPQHRGGGARPRRHPAGDVPARRAAAVLAQPAVLPDPVLHHLDGRVLSASSWSAPGRPCRCSSGTICAFRCSCHA